MDDIHRTPSQQLRRSSGSLSVTYQNASPSTPSSSSLDARPSHLDASALSPAEYAAYPRWLANIKPSRSGEPEHIDEQDALRFLREECGIEVRDEIRILSLFERFPLGLLPGHFFALLRLASWVQKGQAPRKALIFTQTSPPAIRSEGTASGSPMQAKATTGTRSEKYGHHASASMSKSPGTSPKVRAGITDSSLLATPGPNVQASSSMLAPLIPVPARRASGADAPPPVPDDSHKPQNPFRHAAPPLPATPHAPPQGIQGFDPAPNPFKQQSAKPKIVRPTPIVANASTDVLRRPSSSAVDPFRSGASASSQGGSPVSGRSLIDGAGGELKPPPLPPRHISPLIQAGLQARSEVRKRQEMLPPKTFTVLQRTSARPGAAAGPRLLTGEAAKASTLSSRRRADGGRTSASSGQGFKAPVADEAGPERRSGPLPTPIAPKPSYGAKGKTGIPAWLREQEELQKTSNLDSHNEPSHPPRDASSRSEVGRQSRRRKQRTTSEAARIQFLDNESESGSDDDTLSEQARSAASIDRNNPFFQHGRDYERSVDLKESLNKLAVENAVTRAERDSKMSTRATSDTSTTRGDNDPRRPMGRSKTLRDAMGRSIMSPPVVPPRKRDVGPVPLLSGTYPGFGRSVRTEGPTIGGLRQTPISRKAEVGLPPHVIAERERQHSSSGLSTSPSDSHSLRPPPFRRQASSTSQVSESTTTGPRSPSDGLGAEDSRLDVVDGSKPGFDTLVDQHRWLARASGQGRHSDYGLLPGINVSEGQDGDGNEEPEVDEHYLADKRKEEEQRMQHGMTAPHLASPWSWNQRTHPINVIKEEDGTPRPRTVSSPAYGSLDYQQRRTTPDGVRRSASGQGHAGHARRSSLLARSGMSADDVVLEDARAEMSENERTPREKGDDDDEYFVDASTDEVSSPIKTGDVDTTTSSSGSDVRHAKIRTKSSGSSSSASGRAGAMLSDTQRHADGWHQLL